MSSSYGRQQHATAACLTSRGGILWALDGCLYQAPGPKTNGQSGLTSRRKAAKRFITDLYSYSRIRPSKRPTTKPLLDLQRAPNSLPYFRSSCELLDLQRILLGHRPSNSLDHIPGRSSVAVTDWREVLDAGDVRQEVDLVVQ